jgi:hypothetical protein
MNITGRRHHLLRQVFTSSLYRHAASIGAKHRAAGLFETLTPVHQTAQIHLPEEKWGEVLQ